MTDAISPPPPWHTLPHAPAAGTLLAHQDALPDGQVRMLEVPGGLDGTAPQPFRVLLQRWPDGSIRIAAA